MSAPMFAEELNKLRLETVDAQEQAHAAEREKTRMAELYHEHKSRADNAEEKIKALDLEAQQLRQKVTAQADKLSQFSILEKARDDALDELKLAQDQVKRDTKKIEKLKAQIADDLKYISEQRSMIANLEAELQPTRELCQAFKIRVQMDEIIAAETAKL